jgi:uncharacterized protein (DUF1330 family)
LTAYAIANLRNVTMGAEIEQYLQRIDATLAPFGGRFLVHGARPEVVEGRWEGDLIVIGFPDPARLREWYGSEAYQAILRLRTDNSEGAVVFVEGVGADHRATDILAP